LCITQDEDIWDVIEDGKTVIADKDGKAIQRKGLIVDEKKEYKKHHKVITNLENVLEFKELNKIANNSNPNSIFNALCATYEGNQHIKEAKANLPV
jgi:hypothetical protein